MPGGANWNNPTVTRLYATEVLPDFKARDEDALTLIGGTAPSNIPVGAIKYNRANERLQEWDGAAFVDKKWAVESGGTGATTASAARTNLGIGTLGTQNSNAISVTGGSISGLSSLGVSGNTTISGTLTVSSTAANAIDVAGGINAGSGNVGIIGTDGRIPAITATYFADLSAIAGVAIPSGLIAIFDTACPAGWTRVSALDGRFPIGFSSYGTTGGASTHDHVVNAHTHPISWSGTVTTVNIDHTHTFSDTSDVPSLTQSGLTGAGIITVAHAAHTHDVSGTTGAMSANATHNHTYSGSGTSGTNAGSTTDVRDHTPPYLTVVFCRKN